MPTGRCDVQQLTAELGAQSGDQTSAALRHGAVVGRAGGERPCELRSAALPVAASLRIKSSDVMNHRMRRKSIE